MSFGVSWAETKTVTYTATSYTTETDYTSAVFTATGDINTTYTVNIPDSVQTFDAAFGDIGFNMSSTECNVVIAGNGSNPYLGGNASMSEYTATISSTKYYITRVQFYNFNDTQTADISGTSHSISFTTSNYKSNSIKSFTVTFTDDAFYSVKTQAAAGGQVGVSTLSAKAGTTITVTPLPSQGYVVKSVKVNGEEISPENGEYTFTMPEEDVTVTAEFEKIPGIPVQYIDADGNEQEVEATELTGEESGFAGGWYIASGDVSHTGVMTINGDVKLILSDGANMTISNDDTCIEASPGTLTIYGQAGGTGKLSVSSSGTLQAVRLSGFSMYGGNVSIESGGVGIQQIEDALASKFIIGGGTLTVSAAEGYEAIFWHTDNIEIDGGTVTTSGKIETDSGIVMRGGTLAVNVDKGNKAVVCDGSIEIDGGTVTTSGTIRADGNITLGHAVITAGEYEYNVSVAEGLYLTDGTNIYSGAIDDTDEIAGKTLRSAWAVGISDGNITASPEIAGAGDAVTLSYSDCAAGYEPVYSVNGEAITGNTFTMPTGSVTVTVELTPITYSIMYDLDGGTADNPTAYTIESDTFTLTNPTRDGYTFTGWTGTGLDGATMTVTIPQGSTGNREYTAVWQKLFSPKNTDAPEFVYHSLILSGQIGIIFHVYIPGTLTPSSCTMDFDVSGDTSQNAQGQEYFETITDNGYTLYGYKCYINSVQMADEIHATLSYSGGSITETYTAKTYLDVIAGSDEFPSDLRELARCIKDYGCYVQPVLADYNKWEIGKKHAAMDSAYDYNDSDFTSADNGTKEHAVICDVPDDSGIKDVSFALVLDSETAIEIYLAPKDGYTGSVGAYVDGGSENMAVKKSGEYVVSIGNISAHLLGMTHTVSIVTQYENMQEVSFEVKLSALSYVQSAIHDNSTAMKRAVTSIFRYWDATMTYRKNRPDEYKD